MDWLVLTEAAAEAVSQVLVIVACGAFLSKTGYLSQSAQKSISQVNLYFMTPCLLFTKTVATIDWEQFKAFWLIPVFFSLFTAVSWLVAKAGSRWLRFSPDETKFVIAAVLFSNTNSLPMALIQSLVMSAAGSRLLRDEHDTPEQATARGISYILFYAIFANLVRWSYGFNLLVPRNDNSNNAMLQEEENHTLIIGLDNSTLSSGAIWEQSGYRRGTRSWLKKAALTVHSRARGILTPPLLTALIALVIGIVPALHRLFTSPSSRVYSFVIHPIENCGAAAIPMILLCLGAQAAHFATTGDALSTGWSSVAGGWLAQRKRQSERTQMRSARYQPQVWKPADHALDEDESQDEEDDEGQEMASIDATTGQDWFHVSSRSAHTRGGYDCGSAVTMDDAASTTTTLFQFERPSNAFDEEEDEDDDGPEPSSSSELPRAHRFWWVSPVSFALLSRMILVPALCLPAILFHPGSLSPMLSLDPTFSLTLVLLSAAPTAINMIQLCQLKGFFEQEMTAVLSWSYCIWGIPCVLGWSLVGLWAAGR